MKLLAKAFAVVLCMGLLSGCGISQDDLDEARLDEYMDGYNYGYDQGYEQGVYDGMEEARDDIALEAWSQYHDMEGQTTKERGLHPEEAVMVLKDYLNGEYVSDYELETAIRSITYFYYHAWDVINDIENMDVYFD